MTIIPYTLNFDLPHFLSLQNISGDMTDKENKKTDSALYVQGGIEQPSSINPGLAGKLKKFRKGSLSVDQMYKGILDCDRGMVSKAITLIESELKADQTLAQELIQKCLPHSGDSLRIGITGVPGVGKSTFIETFGLNLISTGKKVAVLAIDPSSTRTKGSILGDKTRMEDLSVNPDAYIRPSASKGTLGGVARATREAMIICEAAGYDVILIETVGVGQSETAVAQMIDFFLLLMLAGGGDELQGIKRGIMEMADLIVINKADGDNVNKAQMAARNYKNALHLFPALDNGWIPDVVIASAIKNTGVDNVWKKIEEFITLTKGNGYFEKNRREQLIDILGETIEDSLKSDFYNNDIIKSQLSEFKKEVFGDKANPYEVARLLLNSYYTSFKTIIDDK